MAEEERVGGVSSGDEERDELSYLVVVRLGFLNAG